MTSLLTSLSSQINIDLRWFYDAMTRYILTPAGKKIETLFFNLYFLYLQVFKAFRKKIRISLKKNAELKIFEYFRENIKLN